ncbi:hypothetical protein L1987_77802 [Smallanthus sonchifolius]|uniref:Uncharacterized protein n=1 Tax=Smallanthus sonchifolius TaxID=185202 RepID=A0ACB8ZAQ6_9ASTR|nr:hypothetical protein L1987_77802 [Smallanthus sonchifolius]
MLNMNFNIPIFMAILVATMAFQYCLANEHVVGDSDGWSNPRYPEFYAEWASLHTFNVGDTLYFNFIEETHDVAYVPQEAYDQCHTEGANIVIKSGPGAVNLTRSGAHHYISTHEGDCDTHQKVAIYVHPSSI